MENIGGLIGAIIGAVIVINLPALIFYELAKKTLPKYKIQIFYAVVIIIVLIFGTSTLMSFISYLIASILSHYNLKYLQKREGLKKPSASTKRTA